MLVFKDVGLEVLDGVVMAVFKGGDVWRCWRP